jgi:membrane peptidoglycan carboxypeptidase
MHAMSPVPRARNVVGLLAAFVATSLVAGVLAAGLAVPAIGASGVLTKNSVDLFNSLPGDLATPPLSQQSRLLDKNGHTIATFYDEDRVNVPLTAISKNMQHAIVAIEDARFYQHGGVDPKGLIRAFTVNQISGESAQGASTLTQQYVKNVLVETAAAEGDKSAENQARAKNNARKLKEIRYAVTIEQKMTKDQILNAYLNIAWFGGQVYGVEAAARYYYRTTAAKLTIPQAAMLAGMIQSPKDYNPQNSPAKSLDRRNTVLLKMYQQHMIDQPTYQKSAATKLTPKITPAYAGCANSGLNAYFCQYVYELITKSNDFSSIGKTVAARENAIQRGGLTIRTTLDPTILKAAWKATTKAIPPTDKSHVAAATVTVQPGTGKVLSIMQNKTYSPVAKSGKTSVNYSVDYKYGGASGFQTGSTFKAFTLATWLKAGKSLNATVDAKPGTLPSSAFKSCGSTLRGGPYDFHNAGDGEGSGGPMNVWDATAQSVNGAFIHMETQLDLCDIADTATDLGVHLAAPRKNECVPADEAKLTTKVPGCIPSITLGPESISPMTMAAAYAAFAARGNFCKPIVVTSILNRNKKSLAVPSAACKQMLDKNIADGVNLGLSRVLTNGTAAAAGPLKSGQPASGKTGTTNGSVAAWFIGYTPQLATAVWIGDPEPTKDGVPKSMTNITINKHHYGQVFGATISAPIWKSIMTTALKGQKIEKFDKPNGTVTKSVAVSVPDVTGKSVNDAKNELKGAGFKTVKVNNGLTPSDVPAGNVASTSPSAGSSADPGTEIDINISAGGGGGTQTPAANTVKGKGKGNGKGKGGGVGPAGLLDAIFPRKG